MGLLSILFFAPAFADDDIEEVVVKGNVLYADQVNALKTPVEVLNVPQLVSIITDEDIRKQGFRQIGDIIRYTPLLTHLKVKDIEIQLYLEALDLLLIFFKMV